MFCHNCGNELPEGAKFCTRCGTKITSLEPQQEADNGDFSRKPVTDPISISEKSIGAESIVESAKDTPSHQADFTCPKTSGTDDSEGSSESSNLRATVTQSKNSSRRRLPLIVLVVLALALATSVAYAAYRAYTDILLPQQQEKEAENAYNGIIEEYSNALKEYRDGSLEINDVESRYPHVNHFTFLDSYAGSSNTTDSGSNDCKYVINDLNDDGIPELLIGQDDSGSVAIRDIWSYQDNNLVRLAYGKPGAWYMLASNKIIAELKYGGANTIASAVLKLNAGQLCDIDNDYSDSSNNWTVLGRAAVDPIVGVTELSNRNSLVKYEKTDENGNTESGTCTINEFFEMQNEIASKYREEITVEWKSIL